MAESKKKEMKFADAGVLERTTFDTFVTIKQVQQKESGRWFTIITVGEKQDKTFLVTGRKDGKGTSLMTDWEDYFKVTDRINADVQKV